MLEETFLHRDAIPLFVQLTSKMRRRIVTGEWPPGHQLPTLEQIAEEFGVSRVTVRQAAERLEREGLIWRHRGKGTFVHDHSTLRRNFVVNATWRSFIQSLEGMDPEVLWVSETADPLVSSVPEGHLAPAYRSFRRVHCREGTAYSVTDIHLDDRIYQKDPERLLNSAILPILDAMPEVEIARARQEFTIGAADYPAARDLGTLIGTPVGEATNVVVDRSDTVIYLANMVFRGDLLRLDIQFTF